MTAAVIPLFPRHIRRSRRKRGWPVATARALRRRDGRHLAPSAPRRGSFPTPRAIASVHSWRHRGRPAGPAPPSELRLLAGDPVDRFADLALERARPAPLVPPLDIVAIGGALQELLK